MRRRDGPVKDSSHRRGWQQRWETREEWQKSQQEYCEGARGCDSSRRIRCRKQWSLLKQVKYAKFDETVDLTMRLGVDTRHADQMVRGTVVLPHGLGKTKTVAVIATGDRQKEATGSRRRFCGRRRDGREDPEGKLDRL